MKSTRLFLVESVNPLPKDQILDLSKFITLAHDHIYATKKTDTCFGNGRWVESWGKGEYADYRHFLLFTQFFSKGLFPGLLKVGIVL